MRVQTAQRRPRIYPLRYKQRRPVACRGVRGATTCAEDSADAILTATRELLYVLIRTNGIREEDVASIYFSTTRDLTATYPATAARQLGWYDAALLCGHEMDVPTGLANCIRVLLLWNTTRPNDEIQHVYLYEAKGLRPDRQTTPPIPEAELEAVRNLELDLSNILEPAGSVPAGSAPAGAMRQFTAGVK